jgi:hypothetical protein
MNRHQKAVLLFGLLLVSVAVLGCASSGERVDNERSDVRGSRLAYESDIDRARDSIAEAERAGGAEYGNAQLAMARDKLRLAEEAADDGDAERASWYAVEAELDAELAAAITRNRETQALVSEVRSGLQTLDQELRRGEATDRAGP